jgi:hypothetical protein
VIDRSEGVASRSRTLVPDVATAWRWVGWFSLVLALAGIGDWILAWIPLRFGSPEWEFGTIAASFSGLPLVTIGFAGLLGSAVARGIRWQVITVSTVALIFSLMIAAALIIFLLDVPIAVRAVAGPARLGIAKAIAKTGMLGVLFFVTFFVAAIGALRHASRAKAV